MQAKNMNLEHRHGQKYSPMKQHSLCSPSHKSGLQLEPFSKKLVLIRPLTLRFEVQVPMVLEEQVLRR